MKREKVDKKKMWNSLNKETQSFITALCKTGITIKAIKNQKGEIWKD